MDTPAGLQPFYPTPNPKLQEGRPFADTEEALQHDLKNLPASAKAKQNLELRRNVYDRNGKDLTTDIADKQTNGNGGDKSANGTAGGPATKQMEDVAKDAKKPTYCGSCGIDCSSLYYHYSKTNNAAESKIPSFDFCPPCMTEARYPKGLEAKDFVRHEDPSFSQMPDRDAPWTDSEVLRLLEALEKFDEDWNEIAQHVRTRTREECVVKFLQLEIEDQYLEPEVSGPSYQGLEAGRIPFSQSDNPVLSVLGFLTGLSEPAVAAAAGERSIEEQTKRMRKRLENGMGDGTDDKGKDKDGSVKGEESMEIDNVDVSQPDKTDPSSAAVESRPDPMKAVANTTFAAAAARAAALASNEEREMTRLVSAAVNTTLQKFELKLQQFQEMEKALEAERRELKRGQQQLFLDRLAFRKRVVDTQEALKRASLAGGEEGAKMAQDIPVGGGERMVFQGVGGAAAENKLNGMQPLSAGAPGYSSHEI